MAPRCCHQRRHAFVAPLFCTTLPLLKLLSLAFPFRAFAELQKHYQLVVTSFHSSFMHALCNLLATTTVALAPTNFKTIRFKDKIKDLSLK
jgi:hypothetical protein